MSAMLCDQCTGLVDTDRDPDSLYVQGRECLCKGCRNDGDEPSEFEEPRRAMPENIDSLIAECLAADPRYSCDKCDWDVDGCSPCAEHKDC